jgi:hypothetical protein
MCRKNNRRSEGTSAFLELVGRVATWSRVVRSSASAPACHIPCSGEPHSRFASELQDATAQAEGDRVGATVSTQLLNDIFDVGFGRFLAPTLGLMPWARIRFFSVPQFLQMRRMPHDEPRDQRRQADDEQQPHRLQRQHERQIHPGRRGGDNGH